MRKWGEMRQECDGGGKTFISSSFRSGYISRRVVGVKGFVCSAIDLY